MLESIQSKNQNLLSLVWLSLIFLLKNLPDYIILFILIVFINQANIPIPYVGYFISIFIVAFLASHTIRLATYDKTSIKNTLYYIRENSSDIFKILIITYALRYLINNFLLVEILNSLPIPWLKSLLYAPILGSPLSIQSLLIDFFDIFFTYFPIYSYLHLNMIKLNAIDCSFNMIKHKPLKSIGYILGSSLIITLVLNLTSMVIALLFTHYQYLSELNKLGNLNLTNNINSTLRMLFMTILQAAIFLDLTDKKSQTRKYYSAEDMKAIFR